MGEEESPLEKEQMKARTAISSGVCTVIGRDSFTRFRNII